MVRIKIKQTELQEIKHHIENTMWEYVKCYSLWQIAVIDWIDKRTVKKSWNYLPVRIDWWYHLYMYKKRVLKKPYSVMYIRLDEIQFVFDKRNKKRKLITIQK